MTKSKKTSIPEIKKSLKSYEKEALISMLMDCYKLSSDVKNYIHILINPDETIEELFEKSKHQIRQEFFPERGLARLRLSHAKKAITDFKNLSNDEVRTIDLMIYYVEVGVNFTNAYGDIDEPFYNSMISMYSNVIKKIVGNEALFHRFNERLETIVGKTAGIGWGFHDELSYLYMEFAAEFEEMIE
ncbi:MULTISPECIES: DUF6155 family protein [unclassified Paenibacillus]|uniref:DUF6155 family protein n=1 Tax=unclassified Paenibacillus TaxID=185978 RepID=UPI00362BFB03